MKYLAVNKSVLLLAVRKINDNTWPVAIRNEFFRMTGRKIVYGAPV